MIEPTRYYDEYVRYYKLALDQQIKCNVADDEPYGMMAHEESDMGDELLHHVHLYDVVERKYAGFSQIARCEHGTSRIPNWESYHLEVSDSGIIEKPDLLVMEAVK